MHEETTGEPAGHHPAPPPREPRSARRMFAASVLVSEVLVVLFATLVAHGLRVADRGAIWAVGAGLMVLCVLATGLLGRGRVGYALGTAAQALVLASGVVVPAMLVVGGIFVVLWVVSLRVGARIDAERQERYRAELRHHAEQSERTGPAGQSGPDGEAG